MCPNAGRERGRDVAEPLTNEDLNNIDCFRSVRAGVEWATWDRMVARLRQEQDAVEAGTERDRLRLQDVRTLEADLARTASAHRQACDRVDSLRVDLAYCCNYLEEIGANVTAQGMRDRHGLPHPAAPVPSQQDGGEGERVRG